MNINLTCLSCTKSDNGGFILKLQNKADLVVTSVFGTTTQKQQSTYYMKVDAACPVGTSGLISLDNYQVTEMPYPIPEFGLDGTPNEKAGDVVQLKWLFLRKPAVAA